MPPSCSAIVLGRHDGLTSSSPQRQHLAQPPSRYVSLFRKRARHAVSASSSMSLSMSLSLSLEEEEEEEIQGGAGEAEIDGDDQVENKQAKISEEHTPRSKL